MIMELLPVSPTVKASASNFTGDVYVNPNYRGQDPSQRSSVTDEQCAVANQS